MISYEGLENALKEKGIGKTELSKQLGLSTRTIAKIGKGEKLSNRSLVKIGAVTERNCCSFYFELLFTSLVGSSFLVLGFYDCWGGSTKQEMSRINCRL